MNSNSGTYVLYVGGNWNANNNYGLFYFSAKWNVTEANANLGSRLLYKP